MLKRKRFKRSTVGRIRMFFKQQHYKAVKNYAYFFCESTVVNVLNFLYAVILKHY